MNAQEFSPAGGAKAPTSMGWKIFNVLAHIVLSGFLFIVLSVLAMAYFSPGGRSDGMTACKSNLKNIGTALEMYSTDWSGKYPTALTQLTPNYLKTIPACPKADEPNYKVYFGPGAPLNSKGYEDYYYVECHGANHSRSSVDGDYPAYNGIQGLIERAP